MQVWLDNRISLDSYNIAPIYDNGRTFLTAYNGNLVDDINIIIILEYIENLVLMYMLMTF